MQQNVNQRFKVCFRLVWLMITHDARACRYRSGPTHIYGVVSHKEASRICKPRPVKISNFHPKSETSL